MLKVTRCEFVHNLPCEQVSNRLTELQTENAKLRELLDELWAIADGYTPDDSELDTARDLMRELGIEVTA